MTQPKALRLADRVRPNVEAAPWVCDEIAKQEAELHRLHEVNQELLGVLKDTKYALKKARIWGGMEWKYNPLHPIHYLPVRDKLEAAIAKATGESK